MPNKITEIIDSFGGKLVGTNFMKRMVAKAILKLPLEFQQQLIEHAWFLGSFDESYGYTFKGDDLIGQNMIFLSDSLFAENEEQIEYTILHEIGHAILKHKNSINYKQTKVEIDQQEDEADKFAKQYIAN